MTLNISNKIHIAKIILRKKIISYKKSKELTLIKKNRINKNDIILFSVFKNEGHRLQYFLEYYRKLGVQHFIFVDNESSDETREICTHDNDITLFEAKGSYRNSNFGMDWLNYLLSKYGNEHWCLTCDPDEFLVFPHVESRGLLDLTSYLDSIKKESFFTCMVDMYAKKNLTEFSYVSGQNPLTICNYFDGYGYVKTYLNDFQNDWIQGGVRRRVFFSDAPQKSPALNKIPLIKWKKYYAYVQSMHMAVPRRLNQCVGGNNVTGALLHFKFIPQIRNKIEEELKSKQHFGNSVEYKNYALKINMISNFYDSTVSINYVDSNTLLNYGLMQKGDWL